MRSARCRRCGRKLILRYSGPADNVPRYYCSRGLASTGDARCIAFGGGLADRAIETAVLEVVEPGAIAAAIEAGTRQATQRDEVAEALRRDLEAARYAADRAFRQYDAADPENRLVAAELEARWNRALTRVAEVEARIAAHDRATPPDTDLSASCFATLASDLRAVWSAPTTDASLKKRIVRTLIQEVVADTDDDRVVQAVAIESDIEIHSLTNLKDFDTDRIVQRILADEDVGLICAARCFYRLDDRILLLADVIHIVAIATDHGVVAQAAFERVMAQATFERIVSHAAIEAVVTVAADEAVVVIAAV